MSLTVLAISAPHWVSYGGSTKRDGFTFNSQTPFSLQNAMRDAVDESEKGHSEIWSESNLAEYTSRQKAVMMIESWEDEKESFMEVFNSLQPDILFIGVMSLSFPGAIEIAKYAKEKRNDRVFIVLGGKHINETVFKSRFGGIKHHVGSPLNLMKNGTIPDVFDIVVSGDGEKVITMIGEVIGTLLKLGKSFKLFPKYAIKLNIENAEGNWVLGMINKEEIAYFHSQQNNSIDYLRLGLAIEQFDLGKGFEIFGTTYTAHAYSDSSRGCSYDCFFCSEKFKVSGELRLKTDMTIHRLYNQFLRIAQMKIEGSVSIFVEDSIFLNGREDYIRAFAMLLEINDVSIPFGIQLTLDVFFLLDIDLLQRLQKQGLEYIAFGVETVNEDIAQKLSKNNNKTITWEDKIELMVIRCADVGLKCGMFLIWGFNENQEMRVRQLQQIRKWIDQYTIPIDVGLNIATQHPLQIVEDTSLDEFNYKKHNYVNWGVELHDEYLPLFTRLFGEASIKYAIYPDSIPTIMELEELRVIYEDIKRASYLLVT